MTELMEKAIKKIDGEAEKAGKTLHSIQNLARRCVHRRKIS